MSFVFLEPISTALRNRFSIEGFSAVAALYFFEARRDTEVYRTAPSRNVESGSRHRLIAVW